MSTRQLLNMTMGAFALLLLAAIGIVFSTTGSQDDQTARIDLAVRQQILIQDLTREAAALTEAEDRSSVVAARDDLAQAIVQFDRNLTALLHGGEAVDAAGQTVAIGRTGNDMARVALADGARLWIETGMPLADLAAGEFSVFSAAGQRAVAGLQTNSVELMQHMGTAANSLRMGLHARATIAGIARWAAAGLAIIIVGLVFYRRKTLAAEAPAPSNGTVVRPPARPVAVRMPVSAKIASPTDMPGVVPEIGSFTSPVNFDSVSASVDQMSVDMNTIAGSTEKMRLAIDSVGNALQGMLYSLNEMAQDTAEGHRIVRNANNAASFTATTAGDLATSAREMSAVVTRVTQLAQKTKQVATQIDGEAVHTGKTGEAFTSVVAGEVQGLSLQTNQATREIEDTVAGILATARQYEEAIGQIIKNISAINRVSENLGELMLDPPPQVEPGTLQAAAPALTPLATAAPPAPVPATPTISEAQSPVAAAPDPEPAPAISEPVADDPIVNDATPAEVAAETASAIEDVVETAEPDSDNDEEILTLGGSERRPQALNIPEVPESASPFEVEDEPAAVAEPEVALAPEVDTESEPVPEPEIPAAVDPAPETGAAEAGPIPDGGSNGNVFMLGGPKKKAPEVEPTAEPEVPAAPAVDDPPEAASSEDDGGANVFILNKPKAETETSTDPAPAPATEAPVEDSAAAEPPAADTASPDAPDAPNVYGLELPDGAEADPESQPDSTAEMVPAGGGEPEVGSDEDANIFMLNKPK